jgi:hypothetical protein
MQVLSTENGDQLNCMSAAWQMTRCNLRTVDFATFVQLACVPLAASFTQNAFDVRGNAESIVLQLSSCRQTVDVRHLVV